MINTSNPQETQVLWESYFRNWIPHWGRNSHITIATPISPSTDGYVYLLDPTGVDPVYKVTNTLRGGSAFFDTASGNTLVYQSISNYFVGKTNIINQEKDLSIDIPVTIPEKCDALNGVFVCGIPNAIPIETVSGYETSFPDSWYQGDIILNDSIVLINSITGEKKVLLSPSQEDFLELSGDRTFDIVNLMISDDGNLVFFIDKHDRSLWMLRL